MAVTATLSEGYLVPDHLRRLVRTGDEFVAAPCTLIVPGVIWGTAGQLLYPPYVVAKSCPLWDWVPITVGHPRLNGDLVSVRRNGSGIVGWTRSPRISGRQGKLVTTAMLLVSLLRRLHPRVLTALQGHRLIEVSTHHETIVELAWPVLSEYRGRPYSHVVKEIRSPDHVALLPDGTGACSISDGAGLGVD